MLYLEHFTLPTPQKEDALLKARAQHNGGPYGYIDNPYPCGLFTAKKLQHTKTYFAFFEKHRSLFQR